MEHLGWLHPPLLSVNQNTECRLSLRQETQVSAQIFEAAGARFLKFPGPRTSGCFFFIRKNMEKLKDMDSSLILVNDGMPQNNQMLGHLNYGVMEGTMMFHGIYPGSRCDSTDVSINSFQWMSPEHPGTRTCLSYPIPFSSFACFPWSNQMLRYPFNMFQGPVYLAVIGASPRVTKLWQWKTPDVWSFQSEWGISPCHAGKSRTLIQDDSRTPWSKLGYVILIDCV